MVSMVSFDFYLDCLHGLSVVDLCESVGTKLSPSDFMRMEIYGQWVPEFRAWSRLTVS